VYSTILGHFGYGVIEALNGEEGIAKARAEKPDLILMDISIPIIDGWEATQVLKHDPATRMIPIIALTAHALASDRDGPWRSGAMGIWPSRVSRGGGGRGPALPGTGRGDGAGREPARPSRDRRRRQ